MSIRMQMSIFWGAVLYTTHLFAFPYFSEGCRWLSYRLVDYGYGTLAYYVDYGLGGEIGFWATLILEIVIIFSLFHWANKPEKPNKKPSKYELPKPKV